MAALGLSACGGSSTSSAPTTAASSPTTVAGATTGTGRRAALVTCMESKGIPASALTGLARRAGAGSAGAGGTPPSLPAGETPPVGGGFGAGGGGGGGFGTTPSSLPAGVTAQQYQAAFSACRSTAGGFGGFGGINAPALAAYRNCLLTHGVTLPLAGPGGSAPTTIPGQTTTTVSASVRQAALTACAPLRPTRAGSTPTTATGA